MVNAKLVNPFGAEVTVRSHTLKAGVPFNLGGDDRGPTPHEILEAALAACTTITMQMYATRKQWTIGATQVQVRIEKETPTANVLAIDIHFDQALSPEQKTRLAEIAAKCPIHKLLSGPVSIETKTS